MSIIVNEHEKLFTLHTENTTYQFKADQHGILLHLYYGQKITNQNLEYLILPVDRGFSGNPYDAGDDRTYSLDTLPLEYPTEGVGDFRCPALSVLNSNGSKVADLRFCGYQKYAGKYMIEEQPALYDETGKTAETLMLHLKDALTGLEVTLLYGVFAERDIITRSVIVRNGGIDDTKILRIQSASIDFQYGEWEIIHFHGRHNMERIFERTPVPHGTTAYGSRRGTSSHQHNPFLILCGKNTSEFHGECFGMNLVYCGGFIARIERDQTDLVRLSMGLNDDGLSWKLSPGQTFHTPEVVLSFSSEGFSKLSHNYHAIYRNNLCRGKFKFNRKPIVINNWEATYFDFNSDKLIEIAKNAAELGIEMLVMDDGWFGERDNDKCSLGDWVVNTKKLPGGITPLVEAVNAFGVKFGIWVEPEMISENSDLYRAHPEWVLRVPGRKPVHSRSQLVLDLSREDVCDYIYSSMVSILDSANIEYVKWDMNRSISDCYTTTLPYDRQGEVMHRYVLGLYKLLERLTQRYTDVLFEGCSGGGGRFDPAMLYYHPLIWCSDNTDAIERLKIQYGTSFAYPVSVVSSHVSAVPNHQTGRVTSLYTRGVVAMSGNFGYELDTSVLSIAEKIKIRKQIQVFKEVQHIVHNGNYYRLSNPFEQRYVAWLMVLPDQSAALLSIVITQAEANAPHIHIKLAGLNRNVSYLIEKKQYSGEALMNAGYAIQCPTQDYYSTQLYISSDSESIL